MTVVEGSVGSRPENESGRAAKGLYGEGIMKHKYTLGRALVVVTSHLLTATILGLILFWGQSDAWAVPSDITNSGTVSASSIFDGSFPATNAVDGSTATNWFSDGKGGNEGTDGPDSENFVWEYSLSQNILLTHIELDPETFQGGGSFGFGSMQFQVFNLANTSVYQSSVIPLAALRVDIDHVLPANIFGHKIDILFFDHQNPACGGFSEIRVIGEV